MVNLLVVFIRLNNNVAVMCVCQERVFDDSGSFWHLVPLHKRGVESIRDDDHFVVSTVRKVRPVEAISRVMLVDACLDLHFSVRC